MGARRRWIRNTLAALTALALLGVIGVGVWAASTDEDEPVQAALGSPADEGDEPSNDAPSEETTPGSGESPPSNGEPSLGEPEPGEAGTGDAEPGGETAPGDTAPGDTGSGDTGSGDTAPGNSGSGDTGSPDTAPGAPRKTRFPTERREDPNRRGREFVVPPAREFTGTGNALIGTVVVSEPVVVRWRSRGRFGLEFGRESFPIVAPSRSGELVVPPFRFDFVRVVASGRWTITVSPQG